METEYHHRFAEIVARYRTAASVAARPCACSARSGWPDLPAHTGAIGGAGPGCDADADGHAGPWSAGRRHQFWKVQVGGMDMEAGIDRHAFFPKEMTVNAGDSIFWEFAPMGMPGFHTVTFSVRRRGPADLFVPDIVDGTPVASPEGPPRLLFNPAIAFPDGRTDYDGTGTVNSGWTSCARRISRLHAQLHQGGHIRLPVRGAWDRHEGQGHGPGGGRGPAERCGRYEAMAQQEMAAVLAGQEGLADAKAATPWRRTERPGTSRPAPAE